MTMLRQLHRIPRLAASRSRQRITNVRAFNAATSREKRALNKSQLEGSAAAGANPGNDSAAAAQGGGAPAGGGGGGLSFPMFVGGLALAGAGVAYSQGWIPGLEPHPEELAEQKEQQNDSAEKSEAAKKKATAEATSTAAAESASHKEAPNAEASGNRVVSISLPKGSRRSAAPVGDSGHPVGGHRVEMNPKSSEDKSKPTTESALQELQSQLSRDTSVALKEAHQELAKLSSIDLSELDNLSPTQLKIRLVQLSKELEERTKWEAVRLKEFLAMKEKEVEDKYLILMNKQKLETEASMERKLKDQSYELTSATEKAMQEKERALQAIIDNSLKIQEEQFKEEKTQFEKKTEEAISSKYEELMGKSVAELKKNFAQKMEQRVQQINALSKKLSELEFSLQNTKSYQTGSLQAHRMSAAALSLIDRLESSQPAAAAIAALKSVAGNNAVVLSALEALPENVASSGSETLQELQTKFEEQVHKKCRQAALVPEGQQGLEGQLLGMVFSTLKFPPGPEDAAPESEKDSAEFVLARARRHVQLGELEQAVVQMEKLKGQAGYVAKDWTQKAKERVAVEKALKVIRMECALANESMSKVPTE